MSVIKRFARIALGCFFVLGWTSGTEGANITVQTAIANSPVMDFPSPDDARFDLGKNKKLFSEYDETNDVHELMLGGPKGVAVVHRFSRHLSACIIPRSRMLFLVDYYASDDTKIYALNLVSYIEKELTGELQRAAGQRDLGGDTTIEISKVLPSRGVLLHYNMRSDTGKEFDGKFIVFFDLSTKQVKIVKAEHK